MLAGAGAHLDIASILAGIMVARLAQAATAAKGKRIKTDPKRPHSLREIEMETEGSDWTCQRPLAGPSAH